LVTLTEPKLEPCFEDTFIAGAPRTVRIPRSFFPSVPLNVGSSTFSKLQDGRKNFICVARNRRQGLKSSWRGKVVFCEWAAIRVREIPSQGALWHLNIHHLP
jgi:hypothetical protein